MEEGSDKHPCCPTQSSPAACTASSCYSAAPHHSASTSSSFGFPHIWKLMGVLLIYTGGLAGQLPLMSVVISASAAASSAAASASSSSPAVQRETRNTWGGNAIVGSACKTSHKGSRPRNKPHLKTSLRLLSFVVHVHKKKSLRHQSKGKLQGTSSLSSRLQPHHNQLHERRRQKQRGLGGNKRSQAGQEGSRLL